MVFSTTLRIIGSGAIEDYTDQKVATMRRSVAALIGVPLEQVHVVVTSASVLITVTVYAPDETTNRAVQLAAETRLQNSSAMSAVLNVTVENEVIISSGLVIPHDYSIELASFNGMAVVWVAASGGSMIALILLRLAWFRSRKRQQAPHGKTTVTTAQAHSPASIEGANNDSDKSRPPWSSAPVSAVSEVVRRGSSLISNLTTGQGTDSTKIVSSSPIGRAPLHASEAKLSASVQAATNQEASRKSDAETHLPGMQSSSKLSEDLSSKAVLEDKANVGDSLLEELVRRHPERLCNPKAQAPQPAAPRKQSVMSAAVRRGSALVSSLLDSKPPALLPAADGPMPRPPMRASEAKLSGLQAMQSAQTSHACSVAPDPLHPQLVSDTGEQSLHRAKQPMHAENARPSLVSEEVGSALLEELARRRIGRESEQLRLSRARESQARESQARESRMRESQIASATFTCNSHHAGSAPALIHETKAASLPARTPMPHPRLQPKVRPNTKVTEEEIGASLLDELLRRHPERMTEAGRQSRLSKERDVTQQRETRLSSDESRCSSKDQWSTAAAQRLEHPQYDTSHQGVDQGVDTQLQESQPADLISEAAAGLGGLMQAVFAWAGGTAENSNDTDNAGIAAVVISGPLASEELGNSLLEELARRRTGRESKAACARPGANRASHQKL